MNEKCEELKSNQNKSKKNERNKQDKMQCNEKA